MQAKNYIKFNKNCFILYIFYNDFDTIRNSPLDNYPVYIFLLPAFSKTFTGIQ